MLRSFKTLSRAWNAGIMSKRTKSSYVHPSSIESYIQEAKGILSKDVSEINVMKVAMLLLVKDKDSIKEKELLLKDSTVKENYFLKKISILSQRQMFETFFRDVKSLYHNNEKFQALVKRTMDKEIRKDLAKNYTAFTSVNKLLNDPETKSFVWRKFEFPETLAMPTMPKNVLYGALSAVIHDDQFSKVVVSNLSNNVYKDFLSYLSNYYDKSVLEFDEVHSELDEEII